jgi:hypothetical protein
MLVRGSRLATRLVDEIAEIAISATRLVDEIAEIAMRLIADDARGRGCPRGRSRHYDWG